MTKQIKTNFNLQLNLNHVHILTKTLTKAREIKICELNDFVSYGDKRFNDSSITEYIIDKFSNEINSMNEMLQLLEEINFQTK